MGTFMRSLSPELFWDVDRNSVDLEKNARWLLGRVLERGRWEDWLLIRNHYGRQRIRMLSEGLKIDPKAGSFLKLYCEN
jgi:hypothetical protein